MQFRTRFFAIERERQGSNQLGIGLPIHRGGRHRDQQDAVSNLQNSALGRPRLHSYANSEGAPALFDLEDRHSLPL